MSQGSRFFQGKSRQTFTLRKITQKLSELGIDYVVVGGMAMFQHGYRRFTEDVALLVTCECLKEIHRALEGLGYLPPFQGSKNLRDTENGVKIDFLVDRRFPCDGRPKPVAFPTPVSVADEIDGYDTSASRPRRFEAGFGDDEFGANERPCRRDRVDQGPESPARFCREVEPLRAREVQAALEDAYPPAKRFVTIWRNKWLTAKAASLEEMIGGLQSATDTLRVDACRRRNSRSSERYIRRIRLLGDHRSGHCQKVRHAR